MFERACARVPVCQNRGVLRNLPVCATGRGALISVQTPLLNHNILPHNQSVRRHLLEFGENPADVLIGIDERDHDRQLASGIDEMSSADFAASKETSYGVESYSSENIFFAQIF